MFDEIEAALVRREQVELRGFGVFTLRARSARPERNPKTGALVNVPEKQRPSFRTGKRDAPSALRDLRQRLVRGIS